MGLAKSLIEWLANKRANYIVTSATKALTRIKKDLHAKTYLVIKDHDPALPFNKASVLALEVVQAILEADSVEQPITPHLENWKEITLCDEGVLDAAAEFYLVRAYFYGHKAFGEDPTSKNRVEEELKKARQLVPNAPAITKDSFAVIERRRQATAKASLKRTKSFHRNQVESERLKRIKKISLSPKQIALLTSISSVFFLVSGYLYISILFSYLDINTAGFFAASDYLSSSLEVVISVLVLIGFQAFTIRRASEDLIKEEIEAEYFSRPKPSNTPNWIGIAALASAILAGLIYDYIDTGSLYTEGALTLGLLVAVVVTQIFPFEHYFLAPNNVRNTIQAIFVAMLVLGFNAHREATNIKSESYKSSYSISHPNYGELFLMNSKYGFFVDPSSSRFLIVPTAKIDRFAIEPPQPPSPPLPPSPSP
ncbi:MAG: hypothetical protein OXT49_08565 [Gammaproteobacteria bacterium]|nr:hypothetical protein [Gammaproteobacteria bacterium]